MLMYISIILTDDFNKNAMGLNWVDNGYEI